MIRLNWQFFRSGLLAITFTSITLVLWQTLSTTQTSNQEQTQLVPFDFPTNISLFPWKLIETNPVQTVTEPKTINGRQYEYLYKEQKLQIETRYEPYTDGNVSRLLVVYTPIEAATVNLNLRYQENMGYYTLFADADKLYLSACINSSGDSTVTEQQFIRNRYGNDLNPQRIFWWILGQNDLLDVSCLWTLISTPLDPEVRDSSEELTQKIKILEAAWFDWYGWWQTRLIRN